MSYMSRLDAARQHLVAGEFLEAERAYWQACAQWENSRVRAPLTEKAIEPALRWGAGLFGRDRQRPVLATFRQRAEEIRQDLDEVARLLARDAVSLAARETSGDPQDAKVLSRALRLLDASRIFGLDAAQVWPVVRAYLSTSSEHDLELDPTCLPSMVSLQREDRAWLLGWTEAMLVTGTDLRAMIEWICDHLLDDPRPGGRVHAVVSRLRLLDPLGAPLALEHGRRALASGDSIPHAEVLLRTLAGLSLNEGRLAVGSPSPDLWHELSAYADQYGVLWPPAELVELMDARQMTVPSPVAALAWNQEEPVRLLVLRHFGPAPVDALLLQPSATGEGVPFAVTVAHAREAIDRFLRPDAALLVPHDPPPWVKSMLGRRPVVEVEALVAGLAPTQRPTAPEPSAAPHPVFDEQDALATPWAPLLRGARSMVPLLRMSLQGESFASDWGRENLRRLADQPVGMWQGLATCLQALWPAAPLGEARVQTIPGEMAWQWPVLGDRPWPTRGGQAEVPPQRAEGDLLFASHPHEDELAGAAALAAPSEVLANGPARAMAIASSAAAAVDPTTVTWAPSGRRCPEAWLRLLERWVQTAPSNAWRAVDVLWLYRALASCPEGDVGRWLGEGGSSAARREVTDLASPSDASCDERCRLRALPSGCFQAQLEERRTYGQIWIEDLADLSRVLPRAPVLVVDDILPILAQLADDALLRWLRTLSGLSSSVRQCLLWIDAGAFSRPLLRQLNADRPPERSWRLWPQEYARRLALYLAPAGYSPGSTLLREESQALIEARLRMWIDRDPDSTAVWDASAAPPSERGRATLAGTTLEPGFDTVVIAQVSSQAELVPLVAVVRLAAAASHSRQELVCLDPRVTAAPGLLEGVAPHLSELAPPAKLARTGAEILGERWRRQRAWKQPLTADRLRTMGSLPGPPEAWEALSDKLTGVRKGHRLVLGGLAHEHRRAAAALVAHLARECGDAGPLGLRMVIWVGEFPADEAPEGCGVLRLPADPVGFEHTLLAIDRGQGTLLEVSPEQLDDPDFSRWAGRVDDALWVMPEAERGLASHPLFDATHADVLPRVWRLATESGAAVLACVDGAGTDVWAREVGRRIEAAVESTVDGDLLDTWRWRRVPLEDPLWTCPTCGDTAPLGHRYDLCAGCGSLKVVHALDRAAVRERVLEATARWLRQRGPHHPWMVIVADADEKRQLQSMLGLAEREADRVMGAQASDAYLQNVLCPADLWSTRRRAADVVLASIPNDRGSLDAFLWRWMALGFVPGVVNVLDHPLQWDTPADPLLDGELHHLNSARIRWAATRAEVEFRLRETLEDLLPRLRSRSAPAAIGLGPVRDPGEDPKLAWLLQALRSWELDVPAVEHRDELRWTVEDAVAQADQCLGELVGRGVDFGKDAFQPVDWEQWTDRGRRRGARSLTRWALGEGLLEMAEPELSSRHDAVAASFRRQARATAALQDEDLPLASSVEAPMAPRAFHEVASHGWVLGVAGCGKTKRAAEIASALARGTDARVLVLVPQASSLLAWQRIADEPSVAWRIDVATVSELGLAFLRHHFESGASASRLRLMPETAGEEREQLRAALLESVSRKYAQATGHVPPVDWMYLERLVSGAAPYAHAAVAGAADLDTPLLAECARAARFESGWINDTDLRQLSREWLAEHPYVAGAWRDRYRAVILEDVEWLHPDHLTFVEQMFPAAQRWTTGDPFLVAMPQQAREKAEYRSWRLSKEAARAAGELLFVTHGEPATRVRSRDRHKGRVARHHVLNLESCAAFLEGQIGSGRWNGSRVGVVVGHEGDLHRLGTRLREARVRVWPVRDLAKACAAGPRQFLALLLLVKSLGEGDDDEIAPQLRVVLEAAGRGVDEASALARQLVALRLGSASALTSLEACYVQPLMAVARRVLDTQTVGQAFDVLQRTHLLRSVLDGDAAGGRLLDYIGSRAAQPWREALLRVDSAAIADPLAGGTQVWLASVDQLAGLEFDHLVYLCTGHEPPEQHYRVLGRARESLVVLYSERDPLASPR